MAYILSIIADSAKPSLDDSVARRLRKTFPDSDLTILREGVACELAMAGNGPTTRQAACDALEGIEADVNIVPAQDRRKRLFVADMDSTIIEQECIDELADFAGRREEIASITERAMRGELDFEKALIERVGMLKGLPESALADAFAQRISLTPGAETLVRTMKANGAAAALVSGGFTFFTARVAALAGFDVHDANTLMVENGRLTGEVARPIKGRAAKEEALVRLAQDHGVSLTKTLAVGDGANDLSMLARAGLGVAFRAKPAVAEAAGARIDHGDLTALLYLQGYRESEFAR